MLEINSLSVAYGRQLALEDVSFSVRQGEVVALIGPNGAGKSTLIRAASGVLPALRGNVRVDGVELKLLSPAERARRLAVVPQARNLPPAFTVFETVLLGRTPYLGWMGQASETDRKFVWRALQHTQLTALAERRVGELSGGEQQRVLMARALAQETPILLLDEPTTHLDLQFQAEVLNLARNLANNHHKAVLMALHDLNLAGLYADRVVMLVNGRMQFVGAPHEVLTEHNLTAVYKVPVHVMPHPEYGSPLILPDGRSPEPVEGRGEAQP